MNILWLTVPPWLYAVVITLVGYWGERRLRSSNQREPLEEPGWSSIIVVITSCYFFLSLLPATVLLLFGPMLPFEGAQAGLALAVVVMLFGLMPVRLLDAQRTGWDHAFWAILIDFLRIGGALTLLGWLFDL